MAATASRAILVPSAPALLPAACSSSSPLVNARFQTQQGLQQHVCSSLEPVTRASSQATAAGPGYYAESTGVSSRRQSGQRSSARHGHVVRRSSFLGGTVAIPAPHEVAASRQRTFFTWASVWQDNRAVVEADIPVEVAWKLWSNRELIPNWMPWITEVKVQKDKPELSKWTLRQNLLGQDLEFSWMARNLTPLELQKIHWRSVDGLPNRGAVRFIRRGPSRCQLEMTISYEVPSFLAPVSGTLAPLVESIIQKDLERFAEFAQTPKAKALI